MAIGVSGILVGLVLLYFVRISEASWVGFRAGQILLVSHPDPAGRRVLAHEGDAGGFCSPPSSLPIGLPTTVVDTWNAQDISNQRQASEFRWTIVVTPAQQEAFRWIRAQHAGGRHRPDGADPARPRALDADSVVRGPPHGGGIADLAAAAARNTANARSRCARSSRPRTSTEAADIAHRLRLDYLYVDRDDLAAYPGVRKFDEHPERFARVFANDEVRIYKVM